DGKPGKETQDNADARGVEPEMIDRVSRLGEPITRGRHFAERRPLDLGKLGVAIVFVIDDMPYRRRDQERQDRPRPESPQSAFADLVIHARSILSKKILG